MQNPKNRKPWPHLAGMIVALLLAFAQATLAQNFAGSIQSGELNTSARGKGRLKIQSYSAEPAISKVTVYFAQNGEAEINVEGDLPPYTLRGRWTNRQAEVISFDITQGFGNASTTGSGRVLFRNSAFSRLEFTGRSDRRDLSLVFDSTETVATVPKPSGPVTPGRYTIEIIASGNVLDLKLEDKKTLQQWSNSGARNQQWDIEDAGGGYYYIRSAENKELLTVEDRRDGAGVITSRTARNRDYQQWQFREAQNGQVSLFSKGGNRALDLPGGSAQPGRPLKIYPYTGEDNQRFRLIPLGTPGQVITPTPAPVPVNTGPGRVVWRGMVDDTVQLNITGAAFSVVSLAGAAYDGAAEFSTPLPRRDLFINASKLRGRGYVEVRQHPSSANNYTAIVQIIDSKGGADYHEIEVSWQ